MKKFTFAALAACILLTGCGNNGGGSASTSDTASDTTSTVAPAEKTPAEKTAAVLEAVEFPEMAEVTSDKLLAYYGIEETDIAEFSAYVAGAGVYPDELGVFVAVDKDAAKRVFDTIGERIEKQKKTYEDYSPGEMYKFDDCCLIRTNEVVCYAVCADNETAYGILDE